MSIAIIAIFGLMADPAGARTIAYDGRGNTVSEARRGSVGVTADYDGYGRLIGYDRSGAAAQAYVYNGLDDRVTMAAPGSARHFVYDSGGRVLGEYGASAADVKAEFIWAVPQGANDGSPYGGADGVGGYAPLAVATPDDLGSIQLNWVHGNHLGVPLVTTDAGGALAATPNDYLAPGFPGQSRVFAELYYNRYRDYDSTTGRYIQADPIGLAGGSNPYLYANANPINVMDPEGKLAVLLVPIAGALGGAAFEVGIQAFKLWMEDCDIFMISNYNGSDILVSAAIGAAIPGPLNAISKIRKRYKGLSGAPRNLNRGPYKEAADETKRDILTQIGRGALGAAGKNAVEGLERE